MIDLAMIALPNKALSNPRMYFSLSILYITAVAQKAGYNVKVIDCRDGIHDYFPEARYYGFSCTTPEITLAKDLAHKLSGKTIVGGAHPTLMLEDCIPHFDYCVVGEGEDAIIDILSGKQKTQVYIGSQRIKDLDRIPYPAWDMVESPFSQELFAGERYGKGERAGTIIGSRGCPFACSFCGNLFTHSVYYRSAKNILGEVEELIKRGIYTYRFEDDNFTIHPELEDLCYGLKRLHTIYKCHTRSKLMTLEKAKLLKWSGCEECGLGVESADDSVLKINNKKETAEDHKKAVITLKKARLRSKTYFMAGLPGETDATISLNKDFFREVKPDKWTLSTFTPYPGCDVFRYPDKYGIEIIEPDWSKWWNFNEECFNHTLKGQTERQLWARYKEFYEWLRSDIWKD